MRIIICASVIIGFHFSFPNTLQAQVRRTGVPSGISGGTLTVPSSSGVNGGRPGQGNNPFADDSTRNADSNAVRGLVYYKATPDSVLRSRVFMFHYSPLEVKINELWNPTLDPTGVQFSNRLDALNGDYYLGKGIVGQPHCSLFPTLDGPLSSQLQPDPNIGYAKRSDNIWLYQTMTPYTLLSYHSSLDKDYQLRIAHTQNIQPGWNLAFDYNLISPQGVYTSSGVKNHYLDATTNYFSPDSRLQAVLGIIWQSFNIDENGGISDDSYLTVSANRAGVPVNLYNSGTRHRESQLFGRASYNLVRQTDRYLQRDSIMPRRINDSVTVMDTVHLVDTIPLGRPHVLNAGVIGLSLDRDRRKRVFSDSTMWTLSSATLYWTNDAYPDHRWRNPLKITAGLYFESVNAIIWSDTMHYSRLLPFASAQLALGRSSLTGEAMVEMAAGQQDYRYSATFDIPFDSTQNTRLLLSATASRLAPDDLMQHDALVNQSLDLRPQSTQIFQLQLTSGQWLDLMLRANHLSHNSWYDTALLVHQGSSPIWLCQAALTMRLHIGWLHLDMQQLVQHSTDVQQMPVPLLATKNSLYADLHLFSRALRLQTGVDIRYHSPFHSPTYDYRTGLFCHQDAVSVGGYLWGDLFVNIQVKRASIYLKGGHINALWESHPAYFLLPHYPGRRFGIYWGITWHFFD